MTGEKFAEWMDENHVSIEEAAALFGSSIQTIYKWRSTRGVPEKKDEWVTRIMQGYVTARKNELPDRLTLEPSKEEFDSWNRAALKSGKIVREWAMDALTELAEEESGLYSARHAEVPLVREDSTGSGYAPNPVESQEDRDRFQNDTDKREGSGAA